MVPSAQPARVISNARQNYFRYLHCRKHPNPQRSIDINFSDPDFERMNDPRLNKLLQISIQNSGASQNDPSAPPPKPLSQEDRELIWQAFHEMQGMSDAEKMTANMDIICTEDKDLKARMEAFENFEGLIDNLDNANNMENLGLWTRLVEQLENKNENIREGAAKCCGVAVQNNSRTQERVSFHSFFHLIV